jgi:hypothetical protein
MLADARDMRRLIMCLAGAGNDQPLAAQTDWPGRFS